jgi:hypothetical protein
MMVLFYLLWSSKILTNLAKFIIHLNIFLFQITNKIIQTKKPIISYNIFSSHLNIEFQQNQKL